MRRRILIAQGATCAAVLAGLHWTPLRSTLIRLTMIACVLLLVAAALLLLPRRARLIVVALLAVLASPLLLPARPIASDALATRYIEELRSWDGTHYVWGGETHRGIDCSGFVRQGLVGATARQALTDLDPGLLREAAALWWFDASAQALLDGYRGRTRELTRAPSLNALSPTRLRPGDLAVTADGRHVLATLDGSRWIQADPLPMRVHSGTTPDPKEPWFTVPVVIVRWRVLEPP